LRFLDDSLLAHKDFRAVGMRGALQPLNIYCLPITTIKYAT
jgi:hypothetical protein